MLMHVVVHVHNYLKFVSAWCYQRPPAPTDRTTLTLGSWIWIAECKKQVWRGREARRADVCWVIAIWMIVLSPSFPCGPAPPNIILIDMFWASELIASQPSLSIFVFLEIKDQTPTKYGDLRKRGHTQISTLLSARLKVRPLPSVLPWRLAKVKRAQI